MLSPLDRRLALAPPDDEPVDAARCVSLEDVLTDFGLTLDDFEKMADVPAEERG